MRIVKSELKKIFKNRVIFIALAVFLLLNITNIYRNYNIQNGVEDYYVTGQLFLREQLNGEITDYKTELINQQTEKLSELMNDEKYIYQTSPENEFITGYAFWDLQLWNSYKDYIDKAQAYNEQIQQKTNTALKNTEFYNGRNEFYEAENKLYYDTYSDRKITEIYDTNNLIDYFSYNFSSVLSVIMLLLGVIPIFCNECESDMDTILVTSKNGRRKTVVSKIIATLIYVLIIELVFSICDFASFMCFAKLDGLNQVLYAVQGFELCSADIYVWQFCLVLFAMKITGMCVIGLVFLLLSKMFRRSVAPFVLGTSVFFILMILKTFFTDNTGKIANLFNPISLFVSYNYFESFSVTNILGQPMFDYRIAIFAGVITVIILAVVIILMPLKMKMKLPELNLGKKVRL